jgi:O-antigen/teichoic acid export membrane protein
MHTLKKKIITSSASNFLGNGLKKIIALLINIILIKKLSIAEYGIFNLFITMVMMLGGLSFSVNSIFQRFFHMHLHQNDNKKAVSVLNFFIVARIAVIFCIVSVLYLLNHFGILDYKKFNIPVQYFFIAILFGIFTSGHIFFADGLNTAFLDQKHSNLSLIAGDLFKLFLLLLFFKSNPFQAALYWGTGEIIVFLSVSVKFYRHLSLKTKNFFQIHLRQLELRRYLNYGKYMFLAVGASYILSTEMDLYFLSYYDGIQSVGLYAFAAKISTMLLYFAPSNFMFNVVSPVLFSDVDRSNDLRDRFDYILSFLKINILVWAVISTIILLNIKILIIYVFDVKYLTAIPYIFIWFTIFYIPVLKNVFEPIARAIEFTKIYLFTVFAAIMNIVGNYILAPRYGINGVLFSTAISIIFQGTGIIWFVCKKIDLPIQLFSITLHFSRILILMCSIGLSMYYLSDTLLEITISHILIFSLLAFLFRPKNFFSKTQYLLIQSNLKALLQKKHD